MRFHLRVGTTYPCLPYVDDSSPTGDASGNDGHWLVQPSLVFMGVVLAIPERQVGDMVALRISRMTAHRMEPAFGAATAGLDVPRAAKTPVVPCRASLRWWTTPCAPRTATV